MRNPFVPSLRLVACLSAAAGFTLSAAQAATQTWGGTTSTAWSTPGNWLSGTVPLASDAAAFTGAVTANQPTLTGGADVQSLLFSTATGGWNLGGGSNQLTINGGGINTTGQSSGTTTISTNVRVNGAQNWTVDTGGTLNMMNNITSVGTGDQIAKAGAGTLILSASNSFTSRFVHNGGVLVLAADNALGTGLFYWNNGVSMTVSGNRTITNNMQQGGTMQFNGGDLNITGTLAVEGAGGGTRTITVNNRTTFSNIQAVSGTTSGANFTGTGTVTLSGSNTLATGIFFGAGLTANLNNVNALGGGGTVRTNANTVLGNTSGTDVILQGSNAVQVLGDLIYSSSKNLGFNSNQSISLGIGTGTTAARTITVNNGSLQFFGVVSDGGGTAGLTKAGNSNLYLLNAGNSYQGPTTVNGGLLTVTSLANGGSNSSIGRSSNAASNLVIDSGTFRVDSNSNNTTDRLFTLGTNGGTLQTDSAGAVSFTNSGTIALTGSTARTLTLQGSSSGTNVLNPVLADALAGITSLVKSGTNIWALTGENTYTGVTTINAGTLSVGNGGSTGSIANSSNVNMTSISSTLAFNRVNDYSYLGSINGVGHVSVRGSGTTTLGGVSSYSGGSDVIAGTLLLTGSQSAGSGRIDLNGGRVHVNVNSGNGAIANAVRFTSTSSVYTVERAAGTEYAGAIMASSSIAGGIATTAAIISGTAGAARSVDLSFATVSSASNDNVRQSDIVNIAGTGLDIYVLRISIAATDSTTLLGWLDTGSDAWVNAINGNSSVGGSAVQGFAGTFEESTAQATSQYLGSYGRSGDEVWAVLDHDGSFAAIPEPSSIALGVAGVGMLIGLRRVFRRRS